MSLTDNGRMKRTRKMELSEIIDVLERHNRWRRGADIPMVSPTVLGKALDEAVEILKRKMESLV